MKREKPKPEPKILTPMLQKALLLCACLSLCALIFLFVGQRAASNTEPVAALLVTPAPVDTPAPTPYGVRELVIAEALSDIGLNPQKLDGTPHTYEFSIDGDTLRHSVEFWMVDGYVRGFTIRINLPLPPAAPGKSATAREHGQYDAALAQYQASVGEQQRLLPLLISALAAPLDQEGNITPATYLEWEAGVKRVYAEIDTYTSSKGRFSFASSNNGDGLLTIAFGKT